MTVIEFAALIVCGLLLWWLARRIYVHAAPEVETRTSYWATKFLRASVVGMGLYVLDLYFRLA